MNSVCFGRLWAVCFLFCFSMLYFILGIKYWSRHHNATELSRFWSWPRPHFEAVSIMQRPRSGWNDLFQVQVSNRDVIHGLLFVTLEVNGDFLTRKSKQLVYVIYGTLYTLFKDSNLLTLETRTKSSFSVLSKLLIALFTLPFYSINYGVLKF